MKVLQILRNLDVGGMEKMTLELARQLSLKSCAVRLCCIESPGQMWRDAGTLNLDLISLNKGGGFSPGAILKIAALIRREAIDLVHSHNRLGLIYGSLAARIAGVPVVHTAHSPPSRDESPQQLRRARFCARFTARVVGVSSPVLEDCARSFGLKPSRLSLIENGVDLSRYESLAPGSTRNYPVVGTVGRLSKVKNQTLLLEAFADLASQHPDARLRIVGEGDLKSTLMARADALAIGERVDFRGYQRDTAAELAVMDVFALSSHSEGLPLALIEAMASARPIVSTAVGGIPPVLEQCGGTLVASDNRAALSQAISRLLGDPDQAKALGQQARDLAQRRFRSSSMADRYLDLYQTLV